MRNYATVLAWITEVVVFKSISGKKDSSINLRAVMKIQYEVLQCLAYNDQLICYCYIYYLR